MAGANINDTVEEFLGQQERGLDISITDGHRLTHQYDSYRAYSWILRVPDIAGILGTVDNYFNLTDSSDVMAMAVKAVGQLGYTSEPITSDRVNDRFYYPGKITTEETVLTFDNMIRGDAAKLLFSWMRTTYDPIFGTHSAPVIPGDQFKRTIELIQLDHNRQPKLIVKLYGAWPKSWKLAEFNYSTNEFHTIEMAVQYDFIAQYRVEDNVFDSLTNIIT